MAKITQNLPDGWKYRFLDNLYVFHGAYGLFKISHEFVDDWFGGDAYAACLAMQKKHGLKLHAPTPKYVAVMDDMPLYAVKPGLAEPMMGKTTIYKCWPILWKGKPTLNMQYMENTSKPPCVPPAKIKIAGVTFDVEEVEYLLANHGDNSCAKENVYKLPGGLSMTVENDELTQLDFSLEEKFDVMPMSQSYSAHKTLAMFQGPKLTHDQEEAMSKLIDLMSWHEDASEFELQNDAMNGGKPLTFKHGDKIDFVMPALMSFDGETELQPLPPDSYGDAWSESWEGPYKKTAKTPTLDLGSAVKKGLKHWPKSTTFDFDVATDGFVHHVGDVLELTQNGKTEKVTIVSVSPNADGTLHLSASKYADEVYESSPKKKLLIKKVKASKIPSGLDNVYKKSGLKWPIELPAGTPPMSKEEKAAVYVKMKSAQSVAKMLKAEIEGCSEAAQEAVDKKGVLRKQLGVLEVKLSDPTPIEELLAKDADGLDLFGYTGKNYGNAK